MGRELTFIHAADLHLGASFRGLRHSSEEWANRLQQALVTAYQCLVDTAIARSVSFVILAGDIFDTAHPSYREYLDFIQGMRRLEAADIPVYLCTGNHDPYVSWRTEFSHLPDNVHLFSAKGPSYFCYERAGEPLAILAGRGFYTQSWPAEENVAAGIARAEAERALGETAPFAIGVIHTGLNIDTRVAPVSPSALMHAGMDYWALGHIHQPQIVDDAGNPHIVYSGNTQGCAIDETGPRGVALVTLSEGHPNKVEFIPTASVVWETPSIDIATCETLDDVAGYVADYTARVYKSHNDTPLLVRVTLRGSTALHSLLNSYATREALRAQLNTLDCEVFYDSVIDATNPLLDVADLRRKGTFTGTFIDVAHELGQNREATLTYLESQFAANGMALPRSVIDELEGLQHDAEMLVLEKLAGMNDE